MKTLSLELVDEATPSIEAMTRALLEAPAELLHGRPELIDRLGGFAREAAEMWQAIALVALIVVSIPVAGLVLCTLVDRAYLGVDDREVHP